MPGTTSLPGHPEIGRRVLTPRGLEEITDVDDMLDEVTTTQSRYGWGDLRLPDVPDSLDPASVEAWLEDDHYILVRQYQVKCPCVCGQPESGMGGAGAAGCFRTVTERGAERITAHYATERCTCGQGHPCCAVEIGARAV